MVKKRRSMLSVELDRTAVYHAHATAEIADTLKV